MGVPVRQSVRLGAYLFKQKLARRDKFPLLVELEPLFACNLACVGCGKIQYPAHILKQRMSVEQAVAAVEECGAPVVSIAGGEPLIHPEIHLIAKELVRRKKFVYLCTNAILMQKKFDLFEPSPYFAWAVHVDGLREEHDRSVCEEGVFDVAVDAIREAKRRGFRVTTNSTFFTTHTPKSIRDALDFLNDELKVDGMMISPAYAYWKAPDQDHFPGPDETRQLFSEVFKGGTRKKWRLNHSPLYLDFLEGKVDYECTPWGIPCYSIFGWQRPCYLQADGYTKTYKELVETTDWSKYGRQSGNVQCKNCMAHCGYEPTAVLATTRSLKESLRAFANN
jgi:hopanoid biosynthesis associated radical SAM protein HpnH